MSVGYTEPRYARQTSDAVWKCLKRLDLDVDIGEVDIDVDEEKFYTPLQSP